VIWKWCREKPRLTGTGLPGITDTAADHIIDGRPYAAARDLVDKRIISRPD
jgi:hypothetical protein